MTIKRMLSGAALALAGTLLAAGPAAAVDLVYGSWLPAGEYLNRVGLPKVFAGIAKDTDGAVKWKLVPGGQLAGPKSTFQSVQDGLMAAGMGVSTYVPNLIPAINTIYSTVVFGDDEVAASGAALETMTLHCPQCQAELRKINAVALSGWTAAPYHLTCRTPVATLADLKGKRVRATAGYADLMRMAGAVPIAATLVETVSLLQRGGMDCELGTNDWLKTFGYADIVKNWTDQPLGMTGPAIGLLMNRDAWNKLTLEQKKVHLKWAAYLSASVAIGQFINEQESILRAVEQTKGVKPVKANHRQFNRLIAKFEKVERARTIAAAKRFGVKDPGKIIDAYAKARRKWGRLSKGIGRNIDKFAAAIQREVYDKVDPNKL